jgi:hypothetical protein
MASYFDIILATQQNLGKFIDNGDLFIIDQNDIKRRYPNLEPHRFTKDNQPSPQRKSAGQKLRTSRNGFYTARNGF